MAIHTDDQDESGRTSSPHKIHTWERWDHFGDYGWKCLVCGANTDEEPAVTVEDMPAPGRLLTPREIELLREAAAEERARTSGRVSSSAEGAYPVTPNRRVGTCPVGYCRGEAGHDTLHDIAPCLKTCGPLRPGHAREHDPACPNHNFYGGPS